MHKFSLLFSAVLSISAIAFPPAAFCQTQPRAGATGRAPDGRAYRIDENGYRLVDHIAELEVTLEEMKQQNLALENEVKALRKSGVREERGSVSQSDIINGRTNDFAVSAGAQPERNADCDKLLAPLRKELAALKETARRQATQDKAISSNYGAAEQQLNRRIAELQEELRNRPNGELFREEVKRADRAESRIASLQREIDEKTGLLRMQQGEVEKSLEREHDLAAKFAARGGKEKELAAELMEKSTREAELRRVLIEREGREKELTRQLAEKSERESQLLTRLSAEERAKEDLKLQIADTALRERQLAEQLAESESRQRSLASESAAHERRSASEAELNEKVAKLTHQVEVLERSLDDSLRRYAEMESADRARLLPPPTAEVSVKSVAEEKSALDFDAATRRRLEERLSSVQLQISERKSLFDSLKGSGKGVFITIQPLVTRSGLSLDVLRQRARTAETDEDYAQIAAGVSDIEKKLAEDIEILRRLTAS